MFHITPVHTLRRTLPGIVLACLLALLFAPTPAAAQGETSVPRFEPGPCPVQFAGYDVQCGDLIVSLRHEDPSGPTIRLALAIFHSTGDNPEPDPVIQLSGGPGAHTLDAFSGGLGPYFNALLDQRDVILFDQRGMGYSEPALECAEVLAFSPDSDTFGPNIFASSFTLEAAEACYHRLTADGIDVTAFNTVESAGDVAAICAALGYDAVNLYSGSYGTTLAMAVMRHHPANIRSVVLEGVTPPQIDLMASFAPAFEQSIGRVFAACAADTDCSSMFPNVEAMFYEVLERLSANPVTVEVAHPITGRMVTVTINDNDFIICMQQVLYSQDMIALVPLLIAGVHMDPIACLAPMVQWLLVSGGSSQGAHIAMRCADDVSTTTPDIWRESVAGVHPALQGYFSSEIDRWYAVCDAWGIPEPDPVENTPVESDIPTLVMTGEFDPVTPPEWEPLAAETLPNSYVYIFPASGHGVYASPCMVSVVTSFVTDPDQEPDASCVATMQTVDFILP